MILLNLKAKTLGLDRCLASVLCVGFHDCSGLESIFKVSTHTHETVLHLLLEQFCALLKLFLISRQAICELTALEY